MLVELKNVSFVYTDQRGDWHLDNVNLHVASGEVVGLLGPSGCGKTTVLRLIGGLLKPTKGSIIVDGGAPQDCRGRMAYVFQTPRLLPWRTTMENVALPLHLKARAAREAADVQQALKEVGLEKFGDAYPDQLSGGMAHRVALARALVTKPNLLLLDEPFVGLDVATRQQMQDLIVKLRAELNLTIVLVTHDLTEAAYVCSRIVIMGRKSPNIREDISVDSAAGTLPTDLSLIARLRTLVHDAAVS